MVDGGNSGDPTEMYPVNVYMSKTHRCFREDEVTIIKDDPM